MADDIVENLKQPAQWFRIAFMLALAVALYLAGMVLTLLIIAQALFGLLTGADNRNLRELGAALTAYVRLVLDFLTYNSEFKPFPFAPFTPDPACVAEPSPSADMDQDQEQEVEVSVPEGGHVDQPVDEPTAVKPARGRGSRAAKSHDDSDVE
ncbi:MAG: hypothetical protein RL572_628 [Pseudomonadota bacterium]|jgi:hypothetical protein